MTLQLSKYKGIKPQQRSIIFNLNHSAVDSTTVPDVPEPTIAEVGEAIGQTTRDVNQLPQSPSLDALLEKVERFVKVLSPIAEV